MPIHARLRHTAPHESRPYVDTPDFSYASWLYHLQERGKPIGHVPGKPRVAVIGAGTSGLCAAYELARAGCRVTVFDAERRHGGRCNSVSLGDGDVVELGAMRFPPSQFILDYYMRSFGLVDDDGLAGLPDFPDPGVVNTFVCFGGEVSVWTAGRRCPPSFERVYTGWSTFVDNGITKGGVPVFASAGEIARALTEGRTDDAARLWQRYLDAFGQLSFYSVLYGLFTGASGYDIPGGMPWDFDDFDRFGALGIGSGGFGPLFPVGFNDIFRLLPNALESSQRFFAPGIQRLPEAFANNLDHLRSRCEWHLGTPIDTLSKSNEGFELKSDRVRFGLYDRVIVATTTRAMEMTTNLTETPGLLDMHVARAVRRAHVTSSVKVAARIRRFWQDDPHAIRCLVSDDAVHQVYTLDYGAPDTVVCFISYTWDDDAVKQQGLGVAQPGSPVDKVSLYFALLDILLSQDAAVARWAQQLVPCGDPENDIVFVEWQSNPHYNGAFKLSLPGQDRYVQQMFFDYQKGRRQDPDRQNPADTGCYLAGDCVSWTSGWMEGALQTGLNAAAGVIASLGGTVNGDDAQRSPLTIENRFAYFPSRTPIAHSV